ncbi:MAG: hypothetical protein JO032_04935 [Alphaproteobacteria bacterium]|nr:hypothetical protein [Alphaproteobacteria bacterium]MBV9552119.1 hypothetical protein [Alphaproteobacteria bacterium]
MRAMLALALIAVSLLLGVAVTACSNEVGGDVYENEKHGGYPGPGTRSPGRDS